MDLHYKQEITVGALVLLGIALFVAGTMWLGGKSFSTSPGATIVFRNVETLKEGSTVKVSGVTMGTVERIEFKAVDSVEVRVNLNRLVQPRKDATARIASIGLVGDVVIHLDPGRSPEPLGDTKIHGEVDKGLSEIGTALSAKAASLLDSVALIRFGQLSENLTRTLDSYRRLANVFADTVRGPGSELRRTMLSLQRLAARIDTVAETARLDQTLRAADSLSRSLTRLSDDARGTAQQLDTLLGRMNRGEGSLGRLMRDTLFYDNTQRLVRSLQELVDDLRRNPGKLGITVRIF